MAKDKADVGFSDLHTQLRIMSRLLAAQLRATTGQQEMVRLLMSTGATNAEIADVLDTTPATVATTIQRLRKRSQVRTHAAANSTESATGQEGRSSE
jgi:DNA-binding NarL/FixJ family response regulator